MKIGGLVNETRVSREAIHYCVRESLLPRPRRPGKNVAGYNESYVGRIRLIKELQDQSFLR
ncbi:MAG: MerR family transcriptional regulator [Syntrophobacteraceae bacterium]